MDEPVVGQVGRADSKSNKVAKIEIVGKLYPDEWRAFIACIRECVRKFPTLKVKRAVYPTKKARPRLARKR